MSAPDELRQLADELEHRATQNGIVRSYGIMPSSRPEDDERDSLRAERGLRAATLITDLLAERDAARAQMQSLTEDFVAMEARAITAEAERDAAVARADALAEAIREHRRSALCNGTMFLADREGPLWDALDWGTDR